MAKYAYPAVFTPEEEGGFSINFPDLEGRYTCGDTMIDGLIMAKDILALTLYGYEKDGREIPFPSKEGEISLLEGKFVNFWLVIHWNTGKCTIINRLKRRLLFQNG